MKRLFFFFFAFAFAVSCTQAEPGKVKVTGGWIQGNVTEDLCVYKGIPFAAPPVGDLRWKAPQPVQKWDGVLETKEYGPGPIQAMYGLRQNLLKKSFLSLCGYMVAVLLWVTLLVMTDRNLHVREWSS